jgi:hypothetical protein
MDQRIEPAQTLQQDCSGVYARILPEKMFPLMREDGISLFGEE